MGSNDDTLYWVNTFTEFTIFYVAVSDRYVEWTFSIELPLVYLWNSQGVYATTKMFANTGGSPNATCPGQFSRSFNSAEESSKSIQVSATNNQFNNGARIAAIVGGTVGAILLLSVLFLLLRRKNKDGDGRRGVGFWTGEPKDRNSVQITPYAPSVSTVHPDISSSSAYPSSLTGQPGGARRSRDSPRGKVPQGSGSPVSSPMNDTVQVQRHTDAGGVLELPPAYGDVPTH